MRGAVVNTVGLGGKIVQPLFIVAVTWMFGPAVMGVFFLATFLMDLFLAAAVSGFVDAATIFGSRHADHEAERPEPLYRTLGVCLRWGTGTALLVMLLLQVGAGPLVATVYPDYPELEGALRILGVAVPFMAWSQLAVAATKARMRMEYDAAIMGFLNPLARLVFAAVAWYYGAGLTGLMTALLAAEIGTAAASGWAYTRHFRVGATIRAALRRGGDRELVVFALPQSLNMTFNRYLNRIDVIMLGAFGLGKSQLAFYATAALITSNLRQVRLVFSSSLAPVAARHHHEGDRAELEAVLNRVSRWTMTIIVPVVLAVLVFRNDLLRLVDASYVEDTTFMVVLLISPLVGCAVGLAGNCIIYTGHSGWTLANGLMVAALNTVFNALFIPVWGLMGAAVGTAAAATLIGVLQLVELFYLERIRLRWRPLRIPVVGFLAAALVLAAIWDPAGLYLGPRLAWGLALPVGFVALAALLGHPEVVAALRGGLRRRGK